MPSSSPGYWRSLPSAATRALVTFLSRPEIDALLATPDRTRWIGRRDHTLLTLDIQTGLRVSELTALQNEDVSLARGAHLRVHGKGRKERITPLTSYTVAVLQAWFDERGGTPTDPVFPNPTGRPLGRDAVRKLVAKHAHGAADRCPSLAAKQIGVHTLRHSCAMNLLSPVESTSQPSRCGWVTRIFGRSRFISTATSRSKNGR